MKYKSGDTLSTDYRQGYGQDTATPGLYASRPTALCASLVSLPSREEPIKEATLFRDLSTSRRDRTLYDSIESGTV